MTSVRPDWKVVFLDWLRFDSKFPENSGISAKRSAKSVENIGKIIKTDT